MTSFKKVTLEVDCGGHVSETTFMKFLKNMNDWADSWFDGTVIIKDVVEME